VEEGNIDLGPEWRAFNHSERQEKSRVGAPTTQTMHDKGLTTTIDWKDRDAYGRSISSKKRSQMHRLRKWQERIRTKDAGERNLQFALSEVDRMASALGVPRSVREVASVIYRRALRRTSSADGPSRASPPRVCTLPAARRIPRSLEEIADVSRVDRKRSAGRIGTSRTNSLWRWNRWTPNSTSPVLFGTGPHRGGQVEGQGDHPGDGRARAALGKVADRVRGRGHLRRLVAL